jgi:hypothetical protein
MLPAIVGYYDERSLVIVGDAACVWDDLERFGCRDDGGRGSVRRIGWEFMTINAACMKFPGQIEHAYSNEPRVLVRCIAAMRQEYEFEPPRHLHAIGEFINGKSSNWVWPWNGLGTSALGACLTGIALGYARIVLAGVPLDDGPHNGEPPWRKTAFATSEAAGGQRTDRENHWEKAMELAFEGKVKSMSGRTRKWLGDAAEWI